MRFAIVPLCFFLLFGCSPQSTINELSTRADQETARAYIADLQSRRFDVIERDLDASLKTPGVQNTIVRMADFLPTGTPTSVKLIGLQTMKTPTETRTNLSFEYQWRDKWVFCNVAVRKTGSTQTIIGLNVYPQKESLEEQIKFTLNGRAPAQYAILIGAVMAFCLTLFALVQCIRTKGLRRKWLWIIAIIFGFGLLSTNWATGAVNCQLLYVSLFSAGAFAPLFGPWTISMSLPVGALWFLLRRRRLEANLLRSDRHN